MSGRQVSKSDSSNPQNLLSESRYTTLLAAPHACELPRTRLARRKAVHQITPNSIGVYGMVDASQQLVYVGLSKQLRRRLATYFSTTAHRRKERRIGRRAAGLLWQTAAHPLIAALRERELIQTFRPPFNIQGRPSRTLWGYIIQQPGLAPTFSLSREIPRVQAGIWGPVPYTKNVKEDVNQLNVQFQLRDCAAGTPFHFAGTRNKPDLGIFTPCLRADLKSCLAPCIGRCTQKSYSESLDAARQFLDGDVDGCLTEITTAMHAAAMTRHFERAAVLRNRLQSLTRIRDFLRRFHRWTSQANFVYPIESAIDGRTWWLFCLRGGIIDIQPEPHSAAEKGAAKTRLQEIQEALRGTASQRSLTTAQEFAAARLLHRWFRLYPEEIFKQITLGAAEKACRTRRRSQRSKSDS